MTRQTLLAPPDSLDAPPGGADTLERALAGALDARARDMPAAGATVGGKYRLLRRLGSGGMGHVFEATHAQTGGRVALKLLRADAADDPTTRQRFSQEAQHAASLQHVNNVRILDYGEDGGRPFLVMEYVEGRPLSEVVAAEGPLPWARVARVVGQTLQALWEAHTSPRRLIHRDIKPANLLLCDQQGSPDVVKVLDYGISKALAAPSALTQGVIGSPHTMAPEQWDGSAVDERADLYAVGCTAFELLTGRPPFDAQTIGQLALLHTATAAPPLPPEVAPPAARAWVARLLAKRPDDRFPSAQAALDALQRALDMPDATATAPAIRPPWGWVSWVVGLVGVVGVVVWAIWGGEGGVRGTVGAGGAARTEGAEGTEGTEGTEGPLRLRRCEAPSARCGERPGFEAWCEEGGREVACCGEGLVPDLAAGDGVCVCAPGGVSSEVGGCAPPPAPYKDALRRVIRAHMDAFQACYARSLTRQPEGEGEVVMGFTVGAWGEVWDARVEASSMPDAQAQRCVLDALQALRLPPPPDGWLKVHYPLRFSTQPEEGR